MASLSFADEDYPFVPDLLREILDSYTRDGSDRTALEGEILSEVLARVADRRAVPNEQMFDKLLQQKVIERVHKPARSRAGARRGVDWEQEVLDQFGSVTVIVMEPLHGKMSNFVSRIEELEIQAIAQLGSCGAMKSVESFDAYDGALPALIARLQRSTPAEQREGSRVFLEATHIPHTNFVSMQHVDALLEANRAQLSVDFLSVLVQLQRLHLRHRDLWLSNFMADLDCRRVPCHGKVIDFGLGMHPDGLWRTIDGEIVHGIDTMDTWAMSFFDVAKATQYAFYWNAGEYLRLPFTENRSPDIVGGDDYAMAILLMELLAPHAVVGENKNLKLICQNNFNTICQLIN